MAKVPRQGEEERSVFGRGDGPKEAGGAGQIDFQSSKSLLAGVEKL